MHARTYRRALALLLSTLSTLAAVTVIASPAQAAPNCIATYKVINVWPSPGTSGRAGFEGEFTVTNNGTVTTTGWRVEVHFRAGVEVRSALNSRIALDAAPVYVFADLGFNGPIVPGGSAKFAVVASKTAASISNTPLNIACAPLV
jgi:hypothetical protein